MKRRRFLTTTAATATLAAAPSVPAANPSATPFIDTNVSLGRWPFRRLPVDNIDRLAAKLRAGGITSAWAASFEALLHRDFDALNHRLASACRDHELFLPVGAVHPLLSGWRTTLHRCRDAHGMRALRLHPNYHDYPLDHPAVVELLALARDHDLLVQIAVRMEDPRTQHPRVAVPDVDVQPLLTSLEKVPGVRVQLLNAMRGLRDPLLLQRLGKFGITAEIATLEGIEGIRNHLDRASGLELCFGSQAPFFYLESALLKLEESVLNNGELSALRHGNSATLLPH